MLAMLVALALGGPVPVRPIPPAVFEVDCDAGDSLAAVLRRSRNSPGTRIKIAGTCIGNFVITGDSMHLQGVPGRTAALEAPAEGADLAVLEIREARYVTIRGLTFRGGGAGVHFESSPYGSVTESEFEGNGLGIYFRYSEDGYVADCVVHDNVGGLISDRRSSVSVQRSTFRDHEIEAVSAFTYSTLALVDSEVTGSGDAGVSSQFRSKVVIWGSTLTDNGDAQAYARDRSDLEVLPGTTLGAAGDPTAWAVWLDDDSSLHSGTGVEFHGEVVVQGDSYVELGNVTVSGTLRLMQFSRAALFQTQLALPAVCESGGDLTCTGNAVAATVDCASAAACLAPPAAHEPLEAPAAPAGPSPGPGLRDGTAVERLLRLAPRSGRDRDEPGSR